MKLILTADVDNLGWKLGQVLAGADDALLDSYEAERQPIAAGVLGLSTKKYEAIGKLDPTSIRRGKDEQQGMRIAIQPDGQRHGRCKAEREQPVHRERPRPRGTW